MLKNILKRLQAPGPPGPPGHPAQTWAAAGCTFTDGTLILAGYQPNKKKQKPCITGIGGRKQKGETVQQTAIRETIEELFEFPIFPQGLLRELQEHLQPSAEVISDSYVELVYSFQDLETMLRLIEGYNLESPLYEKPPLTLADLVLKRQLVGSPEITHLVLLPLVNHPLETPFVHKSFLESIRTIKGLVEETQTE